MTKFICYAALSIPAAFDAQAVVDEVKAVCGLAPVEIAIAQASLKEGKQGFILSINGVEVVALSMPEPLPVDAYEAAASGAMLWREAKQQLEQNKAHVVVATMRDATSHPEALAGAFAVTVVCAAVIRLTHAIGVIFNPADTAFPAQSFHDMAVELAQKRQIPEMLWCSLNFVPGDELPGGKRKVGAVATGLFPFIGRDLEFEPVVWSPGEVAKRMLGLAQYLILNGPVIGDGDNVGSTPDEKLTARLKERGQWLPYPVIVVSLGGEV